MERSARGKHARLDGRARACRVLASPSGPRGCAVQRLTDRFYLCDLLPLRPSALTKLFSAKDMRHTNRSPWDAGYHDPTACLVQRSVCITGL
jgi:hypothetical protein